MSAELTIDYLRSRLNYDSDTGLFTWKTRANNRTVIGSVAGFIERKGYVSVRLLGRTWKLHRLAWFYVYGAWPTKQIDHINGIKRDNRIVNLRDVTQNINQHNRWVARADSRTGMLGVTRHRGRYDARIVVNKKRIHVGTFDTAEEAAQAYQEAKQRLHPFAIRNCR